MFIMVRTSLLGYIRSALLLTAMLLILLFIAWPGTAQAVMLKIAEEDLINDADLIVTGEVSSIQSYWNDQQDYIYSNVTVNVDRVLSDGSLQHEEIIVIVPGGVVGDIGQADSLSPVFSFGQKVLLYLQPFAEEPTSAMMLPGQEGKPVYSVYGQFQGKKNIVAGKINGMTLDAYISQIESIKKGEIEVFSSGSEEDEVVVSQSPYLLSGQQWQLSSIPVKYKVNTSGGPSGSLTAIQNAATAWTNAGANFSFSYDGTHSRTDGISFNGVNEVLFYNSSGTELGWAEWQYYIATGNIIEADFYFNTGYPWSTTGSDYDVHTVAMHEFGHWLSLDHSTNTSAIMYPIYQDIRRILHSDDIAGIRAIYGSSGGVPPKVTLSRPFHNATIEGSYYPFRWNAAEGATKYELQLLRLSDSSIFSTLTLGNVLTKELFNLPADGTQFRWKVRAGNADGWGEWSSLRTFTNNYGAFNTDLNIINGYQGWIRRPLSRWSLGSNSMLTSGMANYWRTARYGRVHYYDFDYTVRMRRTVSKVNANYIVVRSGGRFDSRNYWYPGYAFGYANTGRYSIWIRNANYTTTQLVDWTDSSYINMYGYNELRVRAVGNEFRFYINDQLVRTIADSTRRYGGVGVTAWFEEGGTLNIDWASLTRPSSMSAIESEIIDAEQQTYNDAAVQMVEGSMEEMMDVMKNDPTVE